jgi:alkylhydroperoxidase family enzyme
VLRGERGGATTRPQMTAALTFAEKLARSPGDVTPDDVNALRAAGVADDAIEAVIHVTALFCMFNRLADSLEFEMPSATGLERISAMLLKLGYRL